MPIDTAIKLTIEILLIVWFYGLLHLNLIVKLTYKNDALNCMYIVQGSSLHCEYCDAY